MKTVLPTNYAKGRENLTDRIQAGIRRADLLLKIQRHLACFADKSLWINPSVTRERILRSTNGEWRSLSVDDQGNQNLPEVWRQDFFRRTRRSLPQMCAEKRARQFPRCICSRGRRWIGFSEDD